MGDELADQSRQRRSGAVLSRAGRALRVHRTSDPEHLLQIEALYREVFGIGGESGSLNARLLSALDRNSGIVIAAFEGDRLVGFAFGFLARLPGSGRLYHYSQTAAVAPGLQGRGIGRALKLAQREASLADGITLMRWAFDPMRARNGHFNLNVLGGRVVGFVPGMYGRAAPGRDVGERTDRALVEWELTELRSPERPEASAMVPVQPGDAVDDGSARFVGVPAVWEQTRSLVGPEQAAALRDRVAQRFQEALADGRVGVACDLMGGATAAYLFRRRDA